MKLHSLIPKLNQKLSLCLLGLISLAVTLAGTVQAQKRRIPTGGRLAVVIDDRLSALRAAPNLSAKLIERLRRGRFVAILATRHSKGGVTFHRVKASRRRTGWLQSEAVIAAVPGSDDARLLRLIRSSDEFETIARSRIFLDTFVASPLRPAVLLLYANAAETVSEKLSRDADRRLDREEMVAGGAPDFSYFMNYNGLDRYNRQGVRFTFDRAAKRFHYEGAAWREIVSRYPYSPEAADARKRLEPAGTVP